MIFRIQPHEGIEIDLVTKKPGYDHTFEDQELSFMYDTDTRLPDAYEQVIYDAIQSRKSLFATSSEVIRAWEIVAPLLRAWREKPDDLRFYDQGARGRSIIDR